MKKDHMMFSIVFVIYIIAGIASIVLFYNNGSSLSRQLDTTAAVSESDAKPAESKEPDTRSDSVEIADEVSVVSEPAEPEQPDIVSEPAVSEPAITDEQPEEISEPEEETVETDESPDTETAVEEDDGKIYYAFEVNSGVSALRIRKTSERNGEIIGRLDGGDKGYVLEAGDTRTKVVTEDGSVIGYVFNKYITISEIPKKDYPKEYR